MLLRSPRNLHYPITVTELLVQPTEKVEKLSPLFSYFYKSTVTEGNRYGEEVEVEKTFPTRFESETDGILVRWKIEEGSVIGGPDVELVEIEEPCRHDIQFGGMCANCGKDMTAADYNTSRPDTTRASINMAHGNTTLRVSQEEANRVEQEAKRRLLKSKKLSLVVDLDQTIIHATVDPTVAEWQGDANNPNHDAVKDVRSFQLLDEGPGRGQLLDEGPGRRCWYYIKLRPGLMTFLENISKLYELHIYTMGTRAYAMNIAKIVDPERKIFGDRILSRDESGSLTAKNLQRLFPVDTKMVVIIDDRGDVWNWSDNLIKVKPYDFFVGIGDINSSFLPRREELPLSQTKPDNGPPSESTIDQTANEDVNPEVETLSVSHTNGSSGVAANGESSTLDELVSHMTGSNDPASIMQKTTQQDETLTAQLTDRPLLRRQDALDRADAEADEQAARREQNGENTERTASISQRPRHNLLQDDDTELQHLEKALRDVHRNFYDSYEKTSAGVRGGRIAQLRGEKSPKKRPDEDIQVVPDVKEIMPTMKRKVLEKVVLTFSGVVPLGTLVENSDIGRWATSFGASINKDVHRNTTHVIAARNRRTAKVKVAANNPKIKIVTTAWLFNSISKWEAVDEIPYLIEVEPDREHPMTSSVSPFDELVDGTLSSSEEDAGGTENENDEHPTLQLNTQVSGDGNEDRPISPADQVTDDDWKAMMDEIENASDTEDGSEADGDDYPSDASQDSKPGDRKRKRTASEDNTDTEDSEASAKINGSKLQRRKRKALERSSSLTNVATLRTLTDTPSSNLAVSSQVQDEARPSSTDGVGQAEAENYDDDDGFDAVFQAELEAQLNADPDDPGDA